MKKQSALLDQEKRLKKKDEEIKNNLIFLDRKKNELKDEQRNLDVQLNASKNVINNLRKDAISKISLLDKNKKFLSGVKYTLKKSSVKVKENQELLDKEEENIIKKVDELKKTTIKFHEAEAQLKSKEKNLNNKLYKLTTKQKKFDQYTQEESSRIKKTFEHLNNEKDKLKKYQLEEHKNIKNEYKKIKDMELKIRAVKDFKSSIKTLDQKYKDLIKVIALEQKNFDKITMESLAKRELLKNKETDLLKREKHLGNNMKLLYKLQKKMMRERTELSETEFKDYLMGETHQKEVREDIREIKTLESRPDIYTMIERAKELASAGHHNEVKNMMHNIQQQYETSKLKEKDKKKVYYEILDLNTEIKLAALK